MEFNNMTGGAAYVKGAKTVSIVGCKVDSCSNGFVLDDVKDVFVNDVEISKCNVGFNIDEKSNTQMNNVSINKSNKGILMRAKNNGKRKIGRNEMCPCGSNKKYKKCCLT